jgi:hypothetical protein
MEDKTQVYLGPNVTATIQGNHTTGPLRVTNESKADTSISGNVSRGKAS